MKLLRTIRLDPSDTFVFDRVAEPGEWAVSGAFMFWNADASKLEGKPRAAFRSGFLGVESLGWSTLAQIVEAKPDDRQNLIEALARHLIRNFGAPDTLAAHTSAEEEVNFAQSLCTYPVDTLIALRRIYEDGEIREEFRTFRPRGGPKPLRAFSFHEVEGEDEEPGEKIDLIGMAGEKQE